jgi:hypothetical protein
MKDFIDIVPRLTTEGSVEFPYRMWTHKEIVDGNIAVNKWCSHHDVAEQDEAYILINYNDDRGERKLAAVSVDDWD